MTPANTPKKRASPDKTKTAKTQKRRFRAETLASLSSRMLDRSVRQKGFVHTRILRDWQRIAGDELARVTVPLQIRFPRGKRSGATLVIKCSSAFAPLAQHHSARLIEDINRYFGYPAVEAVSIKQGVINHQPTRPRRRERTLSDAKSKHLDDILPVSDDGDGNNAESGLKASLRRLGEAVLTDHTAAKSGNTPRK